ncbi:MAG: hypothetical protein GHCLOJNM_02289 [bacterium]|nr:hypothetical protein [bacterium]
MVRRARLQFGGSMARHHNDWLQLIEVSGPFLSMPVLLDVFPQGLEAHDPEQFARLRLAYEEWQAADGQDQVLHRAWIHFVLEEILGYSDKVLDQGQACANFKATVSEHNEILRPDAVVLFPEGHPDGGKPCLLICVYPADQPLSKPLHGSHWKASPDTRMMELLHATDLPLGLVTNGEQWMLVNAPRGETTGYASWYAGLWLDEKITLQAFRTLLGVQRLVGVAEEVRLGALLERSAQDQQEVTDQLGYQVRRAVEMLVQGLDQVDLDHDRKLLEGVAPEEVYEAALAVMMRLVFLFCAEERKLLLLGEAAYDDNYAVSTLQAQLREAANLLGEEVLERRHDAWCRLLATFRAVHDGVQHDLLRIPAYGGHLFDPDRYPFLEGRPRGSRWKTTPAHPVPINNRAVLHLLESLQFLEVRVPGGETQKRRLSFRALDIEQIGHVYEGLLDHTAKRAEGVVLSLKAKQGEEPEVALADLEAQWQAVEAGRKAEGDFLDWLNAQTGRAQKTIWKDLKEPAEEIQFRLRAACRNEDAIYQRVLPFAGILRADSFGDPVVIHDGSFYVTTGVERRQSGTHYTPRSLTEPIVQFTLEPLVYDGPAEGCPREEWKLRSAAELLSLKICDMACGSGAFLVQACRYLSERLVEAWEEVEEGLRITPYGQPATGAPDEMILPDDEEERLVMARRLIAERCLYGVDKNPMAVEMAKLSLWLTTLDRGRAFTFLDHAIKSGDSLLGVDLDQLRTWSLDRQGEGAGFPEQEIEKAIGEALAARDKLREFSVNTIEDVERKEHLLAEADAAMRKLKLGGDLLLGSFFSAPTVRARAENEQNTRGRFYAFLHGRISESQLAEEAKNAIGDRRPFHWALEFPEVFLSTSPPAPLPRGEGGDGSPLRPVGEGGLGGMRSGFAAIIGNPPFMGGQKITGAIGTDYRDYLVEHLAGGKRGSADLCSYFFLRAGNLLRQGGCFGLLATNTIAQGDTREVGLDQLSGTAGVSPAFSLYRAVPSRKWPGVANLEVAHVWAHKGAWKGPHHLDEILTTGITPYLSKPGAVSGDPYRLAANAGRSFKGSCVLGMGFVLTPDEAQALIAKDPRNKDVLFPYLNGEDLNSRFDQSPSRWVINFFDWPIGRAMEYPDCFRIVEEKVKPERELLIGRNTIGTKRGTYWWQHGGEAKTLWISIARQERVLVRSQTSKTQASVFVENQYVYDQKLVVFATDSLGGYAVMDSSLHYWWILKYGSSLRTDAVYTPSDCFETFPFPTDLTSLESIGERYHEFRRQIMLSRQEGLTKTYNRFHNRAEKASDIAELRRLHVEMDQAVAAAYGWTGLDLGHGFHETKQGIRYTLSEPARREVLDRLLALNHERYAEEVRLGLHDKKAKKGGAKGGRKKAGTDQKGLRGMW